MQNHASHNLIRLVVYAAILLVLTVVFSPVLFQGGKALAEVSSGRETNLLIDWFARWADDASFPGFFVLTLLGILMFCLPYLVAKFHPDVLPPGEWLVGAHQGNALASGMVGFMVVAMVGLLPMSSLPMSWSVSEFVLVFAVAFASEWFFRGFMMGLIERLGHPVVAVVLSAAVFAGTRMLLPPPDFTYADAESWTLGWEMLRKLPGYLLTYGAPLVFAVFGWGLLLAMVRRHFDSLWPGVCVHAAWLLASGFPDASAPAVPSWCALCAGLAWFVLVRMRHARNAVD